MIHCIAYTPAMAQAWDDWVKSSVNGTFLTQRTYMDYHADRFQDASLMIEREGKWVGVLPANRDGNSIVSHGGLTYGGLLVAPECKMTAYLEAFAAMLRYWQEQGISRLIYKTVPQIYQKQNAQQDLYALFLTGAKLMRRDMLSVIDRRARGALSHGRRYSLKQAQKAGIEIVRSEDWKAYWQLLTEVLAAQHAAAPTHTLAEIEQLAKAFPQYIQLWISKKEQEMLAGCVMYVKPTAVHFQYMAAGEKARDCGALDAIVEHAVRYLEPALPYVNFGISNTQQGRLLNKGLIAYKESFAAFPVAHDQYELEITDAAISQLESAIR